MRYMLLIYTDESLYGRMSEAEMQADMAAWGEYTGAIMGAGAARWATRCSRRRPPRRSRWRAATRSSATARSPRPSEQLGGFYLLDVENLDAAIEWARSARGAYGKVELRPIQEYEQG